MSKPPVIRHQQGDPPIVARPQPSASPNPGSSAPPISPQTSSKPISKPGTISALVDKRWVVLLVLFGATAVLGVPLIWRSKGFSSRTEKWFWTIAVCLYTILIFWLFAKVMWWSYTSIRESLGY